MVKPRSVGIFEFWMYLSTAIILASLPLRPEFLHPFLALGGNPQGKFIAAGVVIASAIIAFVPVLVLIWLAARRRKNWARWVLFAMFILTPVYYLWRPFRFDRAHLSMNIADIAVICMEAVAYFFVFSSESDSWFRKTSRAGNAK